MRAGTSAVIVPLSLVPSAPCPGCGTSLGLPRSPVAAAGVGLSGGQTGRVTSREIHAAQQEVERELRGPQPARLTTTLTHVLEDLVPVPGTKLRVGIDPVLTLVPWAGTAIGSVFGSALLVDAVRLRMPLPVLLRMFANWLIDWLVGLLPYAGPLLDAAWRSNNRNLRLLRRTIDDREQVRHASVLYWISAVAILVGMMLLILLVPVLLIAWLTSLG